jgi:quinol monooxygenase YgiN
MGYVVCAKWTAQEGEEERVHQAIRSLTEPSRAEPGCLYYQPCRDPEDPRVFFIFEIYADEAGYKAHGESEHFKEFGLGEAIPALESRERQFYATIDA